LSLAGIKPPEWMQGGAFAGKHQVDEPPFSYGYRARMDERYDLVRSVRDKRYMYVRNYMPHRPHGQHCEYMFQTPTTRVWHELFQAGKLNDAQAAFWKPKRPEELYDLQADPDEVHNLCDSPDHQAVLARLREAHRRWEARIKDVGLLAEWEMHDRSKGSTPYGMGHDPQEYDFDAVFAAAEMASSLRPDDLPKLKNLLEQSDDSAVRYWAAIGLLAQKEAGIEAAHEALFTALNDTSPIVRITAAEALARFGSDSDLRPALGVLIYFAQPEANAYLAVAAWNALDYLDDRARPDIDVIRAIPPKSLHADPRADGYGIRLKKATLAGLQ
jgi:uncharacterized sulfatase